MTIPKSFIIESPNLNLRIPSEADIPTIYSATRYEGFNDGMLWEPPKNMEVLKERLAINHRAWEEGVAFSFSIDLKASNEFVGRISIRKTQVEDVWNIGFWTHPEHQGKGVMTEAVAAVLDFGFTTLSAIQIEAAHAVWNKASERVLQKNGMKFVRHIDKAFMKKGKWIAENLLAINRAGWGK